MKRRHAIANAFGPHSRKVWRAIVGAVWTYQFRMFTLPASIAATGLVDVLSIPLNQLAVGIAKGALLGMVLMVVQLLINEFLVFDFLSRWFTKGKNDNGLRRSAANN